ncbi:MAG: hypothetical protein MJY84_00900 [Bacteroidales bacterium]|nr:hypothetical protein [Bacteroidales bacterium]
MKTYKYTNITALFLMLAALPACEKRELPDSGSRLNPGGVSTSQMRPNVSLAGGFSDTKAGDALGEPVNVYGSEDDGFTITEYVSDMNDLVPMTKGQEIVSDITTPGRPINNSGESFGILGYYEVTDTPVTQPIAAKGLDIDGSCSYSSTWGWDAATTQYTTTYDASGNYTNAMTAIDGNPMWRVNSTERIWSIYPKTSTARIPFNDDGDQTDFKSAIDPGTPSTFKFKYTVNTTLENQEDLLFAYNKEARQWKKAGTAPDPNAWVWDDTDDNQSFNIKFYHAMAAVKFELSNATTVPEGTNVHSITLCYMDGDKNIVKNVGVARYGECTVTGYDTSTGSCGVGFNWVNLGTYKPLHYTYADTYSTPTPSTSTVAGGYAKDGNGVMFMIPQTIPHTISTTNGNATLKIIVEFSKYGSSEYHAVVKDFTSSDVTWAAGNYYCYQLSIGEFHVPGEPLVGKASLSATNIKFTHGGIAYSSFIPAKGVERIGLVLDGYNTKDNGAADFYLYAVFDGNTPSASTYNPPTPETFEYDFLDVTLPTTGAVLNTTYTFGDGATETYSTAYHFDLYPTKTYTGLYYYVFKVNSGASTFNIGFSTNSSNNSAFFKGNILGILVLKVEEDPNLPNDFNEIDWANI